MNREHEKRLLVAGIGNEAMGDDGLGGIVVRELQTHQLPAGIQLTVLGPDPLELLALEENADGILVIDAVSSHGRVGSIRRLSADGILTAGEDHRPHSLHQLGLKEAVGLLRTFGDNTPVVFLGVEIAKIRPAENLSPELAEALPEIVDSVATEIRAVYDTL